MPVHRTRQVLPLLAWFASLAAGIALFSAMGDGALAAPPLGTPSAWGDWAAARDPIVAAVAVLRLVVLALSWYLVAVTTVGLVARLTRAARLVAVADALSLPVVRNVLQGALGLTLAAGVVAASSGPLPVPRATTPGGPSVSVADGSEAVAMVGLDGDGVRARMVAAEGEAGRAEMVAIDADGSRAEMVAIDDAPPAQMSWLGPPGATEAATDEDQVDARAEHVVVGGDHLWNIAERTVADHLGRAPDDREIATYWQELIETNRDRLADPDNPDLLFPGQVVQLPDPGAGPASS